MNQQVNFSINAEAISPHALLAITQAVGRAAVETSVVAREADWEFDEAGVLEYPCKIQLASGEWRIHIGGVLWPDVCVTECECSDRIEKYVTGNPDHYGQLPGGSENPPPKCLIPFMIAVPEEIAKAVKAMEEHIHVTEDRFPVLVSSMVVGNTALKHLCSHPGYISEEKTLRDALAPLYCLGALDRECFRYLYVEASINVLVQRGYGELVFTSRNRWEVVSKGTNTVPGLPNPSDITPAFDSLNLGEINFDD